MNIGYYIFVSLLLFIIIYWKADLHKNKKLMSVLTAAGGLGLLYLAFDEIREDDNDALNDSTVRFQENRNLTNNLITDHNAYIFNIYGQGQESSKILKNYYNELIGIKKVDNNPNIDHTVEIAYTMTIFMHMSQAISTKIFYKDNSEMDIIRKGFEKRVIQMLTQYLKHPRFRQYWSIYKKIYGIDYMNEFMMKNFGI
jgi:hypothetical protein